ncbi:TRAP transporter small permease [Vibrio alginolyticus]|nr:TRAP transporter small permease [Vibrio alginolyticus]
MDANIIKFKSLLDKIILSFCSIALFLLVISVSWQVFSRYVLNDPSSFTDELARYLMIWFGLLGASYLFGKNGHLAITLFIHSISKKYQKACSILIHLTSLSFISLAMIKGGIQLMGRTTMQFSPALQIPMSYVYFILPLAGSLMTIYILINIANILATPTQERG